MQPHLSPAEDLQLDVNNIVTQLFDSLETSKMCPASNRAELCMFESWRIGKKDSAMERWQLLLGTQYIVADQLELQQESCLTEPCLQKDARATYPGPC